MKQLAAALWLCCAAAACADSAVGPSAAPSNGAPAEVVVEGQGDSSALNARKPPLSISVDPFESIRRSLEPDPSLLLAVSPMTVSWRRTHPESLMSDRVIQPWRMTFSPRAGIIFRVRDRLAEALQRKLDAGQAKEYAWTLTIADEEGRVFQHYEGSKNPPEELIWSGQNDQDEWVRPGRSYSAIYTFTDSSGASRTVVGKPLLFTGIVHQEDTGMHVSLDSAVLFGDSKSDAELARPAGLDLLRAAADLIKRRLTGIPISVRVFAATEALAETQAQAIDSYLVKELMLAPKNISFEAAGAEFAQQRVELVLLNR
ncbi:MAG: hypothetical protein KGO96_09140 [Elusimicrobia bacterium]|nr:hypothetical protein [Elusimicrobiota bacterium]MDE2426054.1 hypothetical protein [Elusimicrobiota bacterium]